MEELELPPTWKIHPIISVIHLEQHHEDDFGRTPPDISSAEPIMVGGHAFGVLTHPICREENSLCVIRGLCVKKPRVGLRRDDDRRRLASRSLSRASLRSLA